MICDTGHNIDGIKVVLRQIASQKYRQLHMVWGMVKDKDVSEVLNVLPKEAFYYFCQAKIPRAHDAVLLREKAKAAGLDGVVVADVNEAIETALQRAHPDDFIFVGGSTFVVAEIQNL
jgi:dihydrofolate synthase / folylpolyglutamate synthase